MVKLPMSDLGQILFRMPDVNPDQPMNVAHSIRTRVVEKEDRLHATVLVEMHVMEQRVMIRSKLNVKIKDDRIVITGPAAEQAKPAV